MSEPPPIRFADALASLVGAGHTARFVATGDSMDPAIRDGDVVHVAQLLSDIRKGDVIAFLAGERLFLHRVIGIQAAEEGETYLCRGDNAAAQDDPVRRADVIGLVTAVERDGRPRECGRRIPWRARLRKLCRFAAGGRV